MALTFESTEGWEAGSEGATITADAEGDLAPVDARDAWKTWLQNNAEDGAGQLTGTSLYRTRHRVSEVTANTATSEYYYNCTANYESVESSSVQRQPRDRHEIGDDDEITITTSGGTENVKFALASEDTAGDTVTAAEKLIGWTGGDKDEQSIEGVDIPVPSLNISWKMFVARSDITESYITGLASRKGGVNNSSWNGFAKGEARFEDATVRFGPDANGDDMAELIIDVSCLPNRTAAGGDAIEITGWDPANPGSTTTFTVDKRGWSYLSTPTKEDVLNPGTADEILIVLPVAAYVQQVSPYIDFANLVP